MKRRFDKEKALELYKEGKIDREIGVATGYSPTYVNKWRKSEGLPTNYKKPETRLGQSFHYNDRSQSKGK